MTPWFATRVHARAVADAGAPFLGRSHAPDLSTTNPRGDSMTWADIALAVVG